MSGFYMRATLTFNGIIIAQCLVKDHMIANNLDHGDELFLQNS